MRPHESQPYYRNKFVERDYKFKAGHTHRIWTYINENMSNPNKQKTMDFSDETGTGTKYETLSLQSTLNLQNGDQIWFQFDYFSPGSFLFGSRFTHFNGFLLEEEISQSYINV